MKKIVFLISLVLIGTTCFAQRGNVSSSRGGGSHASSSRSSVSTSRSSSPSRSTATYSSPSRTTRSSSSVSRPSSTPTRQSANISRPATRSSVSTSNRPSAVRTAPRSENRPQSRGVRTTPPANRPSAAPANHPTAGPQHRPHHHHHPAPHGMHPMPPMYHPIHHHHMPHMHYHYCDWRVHSIYWYGYWEYVHTYPYSDVVVYVRSTRPSTELIAMDCDEYYVYTIYRDDLLNETYFTISDREDNVLARTKVNRRYCRIFLDEGGVWLLRKNDKKPIYFIYQDGNLYRYEED